MPRTRIGYFSRRDGIRGGWTVAPKAVRHRSRAALAFTARHLTFSVLCPTASSLHLSRLLDFMMTSVVIAPLLMLGVLSLWK